MGRHPVRTLGTAKHPQRPTNLLVFSSFFLFLYKGCERSLVQANGEAFAKDNGSLFSNRDRKSVWVCVGVGGVSEIGLQRTKARERLASETLSLWSLNCAVQGIDRWPWCSCSLHNRDPGWVRHTCVYTFQDMRPGWEQAGSATIDLLSQTLPAKPERPDPPW